MVTDPQKQQNVTGNALENTDSAMTAARSPGSTTPEPDFAVQAQESSPGILREFVQFLGENKKWWLIPILVAIGLITLLVAMSSSAVAPLIYPLF